MDGCEEVVDGTVEVDFESLEALDTLTFTEVDFPYESTSYVIGISITAQLASLTADIGWKFCESSEGDQTCSDAGTTPMSSDTIEIAVTGKLELVYCEKTGENGVYMTHADVDVIQFATWGVSAWIDTVESEIDSSLDWLVDNLSDLFDSSSVTVPFESAQNAVNDQLGQMVEAAVQPIAVIGCEDDDYTAF